MFFDGVNTSDLIVDEGALNRTAACIIVAVNGSASKFPEKIPLLPGAGDDGGSPEESGSGFVDEVVRL